MIILLTRGVQPQTTHTQNGILRLKSVFWVFEKKVLKDFLNIPDNLRPNYFFTFSNKGFHLVLTHRFLPFLPSKKISQDKFQKG